MQREQLIIIGKGALIGMVMFLIGCETIETKRDISINQTVSIQKARFEESLSIFIVRRDQITRDYVTYLREKVLLDSLINQGHRVGNDIESLMIRRLELKEKLILLKAADAEYTNHIEILDQEMKDWDEKHPGWWR